jgi:hypothetical protein
VVQGDQGAANTPFRHPTFNNTPQTPVSLFVAAAAPPGCNPASPSGAQSQTLELATSSTTTAGADASAKAKPVRLPLVASGQSTRSLVTRKGDWKPPAGVVWVPVSGLGKHRSPLYQFYACERKLSTLAFSDHLICLHEAQRGKGEARIKSCALPPACGTFLMRMACLRRHRWY